MVDFAIVNERARTTIYLPTVGEISNFIMFLAAIAATYVYIQATRQLFSGFKGLIHQRLIGLLRKIIHYCQKRIIKKDYSLFPKIKKDNSGKSSTVSG